MAKAKNKKKVSSDRVHLKKDPKKANPFEVHVNKEKFKVIGKKQKNDRGLPGISRAKAIQKRKSTLLEEYKVQNKNNKFVDRRIGEKGPMDNEEKVMARFTALKMKSHSKKNIFNLADDEILTHKGQTLNEIEKFDDPRSDDEDLSDTEKKTGNLESNFIKQAHFGGGLFKNTGKEGAMTHKDLINQLIVESKKRKAEKQQLKEATLELTEKLDTEWKDLIPLVNSAQTKEDEVKKQPINDYDKVMRELRFEKRGTVSDRLKTEDEIAKEEKENLEKLEQERIKRMNHNDEEIPKQYHRSADDLDDGFVYDNDDEDTDENVLSYNAQGISNYQIEANVNGTILKANKNTEAIDNEDLEKEHDRGDEEQSSSEEIETDSEDNLSDLKEEDSESEVEEQNIEKESNDNEEFNENDKKGVDEDNAVNTNTAIDNIKEVPNKCIIGRKGDKNEKYKENYSNEDKIINDTPKNSATKNKVKSKKSVTLKETDIPESKVDDNTDPSEMMTCEETLNADVADKLDIPFTFSLPESYESLLKSLEMYDNHQNIVIQRMVKCNHPSLSEKNKDKLGLLFAYILQYLNDLFSESMDIETIKKHFNIFQCLVPQIYDLAKFNPENAHSSVLEVIKEKFEEYKKRPKVYPGVEVLVFFKLVSILFSTSDFRHQIVTPCYVFMEQILTKCKVKDRKDIAYGLFVSSLILEYSVLSKRYLPAVMNFLSGLLHMAIPKTSVQLIKIAPPFKSTSTHLVLIDNCSLTPFKSMKLNTADFCDGEITGEYQVRGLYNILRLLEQFLEHYKLLSSHVEIFEKVLKHLELIPVSNYPKIVQSSVKNVIESLKKLREERRLEYLVMELSKPKALRLYEPKVQVIYDGKQYKNQTKEKAQRNKLIHKLKREKKGALREIRRDNAFLGRVKISSQLRSDMERKEKVKRIYSEAAVQQSELNEIDRKKKRKH